MRKYERGSAKIRTRQCENKYAAAKKYERGSAKIRTRQWENTNAAVRKYERGKRQCGSPLMQS
jgi:hypothetical protein